MKKNVQKKIKYSRGCNSNQGALNSKQKNEMGFDRNESGRGSNDGSVLEWVRVMGSINKV